ncbi:MAG: hypothetical protein NTZ00_09940 [Bacteroidetes bacterium]|nr:hypothetical protein [Bacteroidota bacterium]
MEANKTPLLEVLNNLASIHHEVRNDQTQLLDIEKLGKLKLLAAQLYMEVDIELLSMEFPELQETDPELSSDAPIYSDIEPTSDLVINMFVPEEEIVNIELPFAEIAIEIIVTDEILAVQETVVEVVEQVQITLPEPVPAAAIEPVDKGSSAHTLAGIIGQFPLSRRFEFSNILFGGDMDNMGLFVQEIIDAPNAAARGDVYDRWYEQKQWRRRDESASDMWRMIKRIFTQ